MDKIRPSILAWLAAAAICLTMGIPPAGAQPELKSRVFGDFTLGFYGNNREALRLHREEVISKTNYCPTSGCVLRLNSVAVRPDKATGGETMVLSTTYTILTPDNLAIPVTITREVFFRDQSLGVTKSTEYSKINGTWTQEVDFTLPPHATPGLYTLKTKITTGFDSVNKEAHFWVE